MQQASEWITTYVDYLSTPLGCLSIVANGSGVTQVRFVQQQEPVRIHAYTELAKAQLSEYFAGQRQKFNLPLAALGSGFQQQVWQQLRHIDYAQTCSYADIAKQINNPKAVRAVGAANGKNPIVIIVPCHRVIGANGTLTGYAGGLERKQWLLNWEQQNQ